MAKHQNDPKVESAEGALVDPRDAELAKLRAELAATAKAKAEVEKNAADAADYAKALEQELRDGRNAGAGSESGMMARFLDTQVELTKAIKELAAQGRQKEMPRHADLVDESGEIPLDPKYLGKKKYKLTQPGFHQGRYMLAGSVIEVEDQKPSRTWVLIEAKAKPAEVASESVETEESRPTAGT